MFDRPDTAVFLFLSIGAIALFSFLIAASTAGSRAEERKSYYKNDMLKKLAESPAEGAAATLNYLREQQHFAARKKRGDLQLGGIVTAAIGVALGVFLAGVAGPHPVYLVGLFPLLIGAALLWYAHSMMPIE